MKWRGERILYKLQTPRREEFCFLILLKRKGGLKSAKPTFLSITGVAPHGEAEIHRLVACTDFQKGRSKKLTFEMKSDMYYFMTRIDTSL